MTLRKGISRTVDTPIKTPIGTAWMDADGILWHRMDDGVSVSGSLAQRTADVIGELLDGRAAPAIVDITDIRFADGEAREVFARLGSATPEVATAILVRSQENPVPGILLDFFSKLDADRPIKFFDSEDAAVAWARSFIDDAPTE